MNKIDRSWIQGELLSFTSRSGIWLDGILYAPPEAVNSKGVIVHVHGSFGNFYTNRWLRRMARIYVSAGFYFLVFNLSTHDGVAEAYVDRGEELKPEFTYVGHSIRDFNTFADDIGGAVDFARGINANVILQGHSQGCDKIVGYAQTTGDAIPLVLFSPADTKELYRRYVNDDKEFTKLDEILALSPFSPPYDWLPIEAYGVNEPPSEIYQIPICASALESLLRQGGNYLLDFKYGDNYYIDAPIFIFLGGQDGYQTCPAEEVFKYFESKFQSIHKLFMPENDHELRRCAEVVAREVVSWAAGLLYPSSKELS